MSPNTSTHLRWLVVLLVVAAAVPACREHEKPQHERVDDPLFPSGWSLLERTRPVEATEGMVVSGHPLASAVGAKILEQGGNAIDAAVAVGFALAVVLPESGNLGGGGFLVYREDDGAVHALDFRETAPAGASRDMYLDADGELTQDSRIGHRASGVPGSVAGFSEMHQHYATLPWADLVEPAISLARGHEIDELRSSHLADGKSRLERFEPSARQFLPDGEAPQPGYRWAQPDLEKTLTRIANEGAQEFYNGQTADLLVAEMTRGGGLINHQDLTAYEAVWREPVRVRYRDHLLWSMPPSSSGGVTLALILNILQGYENLPPFGSGELVHVEAEAMRWAFLERNLHLGDSDFVDLPLERMLSDEYATELRSRIQPGRAGETPVVAYERESESTTHYSVVDAEGRAAAVTVTLNSSYGNGVTVTGAGFLLNNEMDDFAAKPGSPNQFQLVQGEANAIAPGKRMLSSMTPTIVESPQGELLMVVGTSGGSTIITSVFHVLSNVLDHGMSLGEAVAAPRVHHQALPDLVFYEQGGLSEETVGELEAFGHTLEQRDGYSGDIAAIMRVGGGWIGVADPRRGGGAVGVGSEE